MNFVYVIFGATGPSDDRREWIVEAREHEVAAAQRIEALKELMQRHGANRHPLRTPAAYSDAPRIRRLIREDPQGDPRFDFDPWTGTQYRFERVAVVRGRGQL